MQILFLLWTGVGIRFIPVEFNGGGKVSDLDRSVW